MIILFQYITGTWQATTRRQVHTSGLRATVTLEVEVNTQSTNVRI
uniref:Uncharacterized protein n=1 Tax=Anguilla anguilla TaxID=7936 RepID=A0A0E9U0R4_ANGAN